MRRMIQRIFVATVCCLTIPVCSVAAGDLTFYEGNGCSQDIVFEYDSRKPSNDNCKKSGACEGDNDEARSLKIKQGALAGTVITVYDSPEGDTTDDYTKIVIGKDNPGEICIETFERSTVWRAATQAKTPRAARTTYTEKNGLDGKISRVHVAPPEDIDF